MTMKLGINVLQCWMFPVENHNQMVSEGNFIKVREDISLLIWKCSVMSDGESQVFNLCGAINTLRVIQVTHGSWSRPASMCVVRVTEVEVQRC